MDIKEKMKKFNQRWGISSDNTGFEEFQKFKRRILNIFEDLNSLFQPSSKDIFYQFFSIQKGSNLFSHLSGIEKEIEFYKCLELIFSLEFRPENIGRSYTGEEIKRNYFLKVSEALDFSCIDLGITGNYIEGKLNVILYPKGEELLDTEIVNNVLSFLSGASSEHFQSALNLHLAKDWIKAGESIRRTLEEFLREKFSNKKGLKANITELASFLKGANVPSQTKNIIGQTFSYLDDYFNDHTKHNDGNLDEYDAEFLIYQAGLLMRYISKVIK